MGGVLRDLLTFILGFVVLGVLILINFIINICCLSILAALSVNTNNNTLVFIGLYFVGFFLITIPYAVLTSYFIFNTIIPLNTKKYGMLGGHVASGVLCWLFSNWTLPYVLLAKIWPVKYVEEPEPIPNARTKFYIGWAIGFFLSIVQMVFMFAIKQA